jgi:hypothetical protein
VWTVIMVLCVVLGLRIVGDMCISLVWAVIMGQKGGRGLLYVVGWDEKPQSA